jgi:hypothetical protein
MCFLNCDGGCERTKENPRARLIEHSPLDDNCSRPRHSEAERKGW